MKRFIAPVMLSAATLLLSGCYTQLAIVERPRPAPSQPCPDSVADCNQEVAPDTVVIQDDSREVCYWTRDWRGRPTLRCYRTYYSDGWVSFYSDPWWYSRYDSYWGYSSCPTYYYYDPYTGYCRYYRDFDRYYYPSRPSGSATSTGSATGSTSSRPPRRSITPPSRSVTPSPTPKKTDPAPSYTPGGSVSSPAPSTPSTSTRPATRPRRSTTRSARPAATPPPATTDVKRKEPETDTQTRVREPVRRQPTTSERTSTELEKRRDDQESAKKNSRAK